MDIWHLQKREKWNAALNKLFCKAKYARVQHKGSHIDSYWYQGCKYRNRWLRRNKSRTSISYSVASVAPKIAHTSSLLRVLRAYNSMGKYLLSTISFDSCKQPLGFQVLWISAATQRPFCKRELNSSAKQEYVRVASDLKHTKQSFYTWYKIPSSWAKEFLIFSLLTLMGIWWAHYDPIPHTFTNAEVTKKWGDYLYTIMKYTIHLWTNQSKSSQQ